MATYNSKKYSLPAAKNRQQEHLNTSGGKIFQAEVIIKTLYGEGNKPGSTLEEQREIVLSGMNNEGSKVDPGSQGSNQKES